MSRFYCPSCEQVRHVAEPGVESEVEDTGEPVTEDCCWFCGTAVPTGETVEFNNGRDLVRWLVGEG